LQVTSELVSGEELAAHLSLPSVEVHNKGERISPRSGSHYYSKSIVRLTSQLSVAASVGEHIESLLSAFETRSAGISQVREKCGVELWVKISFEPSQLGFDLNTRTIRRLADSGVELIFDIYIG
jgi:hypothetical protein